jgi:hypothetical protein
MRPEYQIEERRVITFARANVNGHRKWIMNANAGRESIRSEWPSVFGAQVIDLHFLCVTIRSFLEDYIISK